MSGGKPWKMSKGIFWHWKSMRHYFWLQGDVARHLRKLEWGKKSCHSEMAREKAIPLQCWPKLRWFPAVRLIFFQKKTFESIHAYRQIFGWHRRVLCQHGKYDFEVKKILKIGVNSWLPWSISPQAKSLAPVCTKVSPSLVCGTDFCNQPP